MEGNSRGIIPFVMEINWLIDWRFITQQGPNVRHARSFDEKIKVLFPSIITLGGATSFHCWPCSRSGGHRTDFILRVHRTRRFSQRLLTLQDSSGGLGWCLWEDLMSGGGHLNVCTLTGYGSRRTGCWAKGSWMWRFRTFTLDRWAFFNARRILKLVTCMCPHMPKIE